MGAGSNRHFILKSWHQLTFFKAYVKFWCASEWKIQHTKKVIESNNEFSILNCHQQIHYRLIGTFFSLSDATFIGQYIAFKLMCGSLRKVRENYPERLCEEFSSSKGKRFKYKMHNTSMICITSWKIRLMLFPFPSKNMYSFMTSPKFPTNLISPVKKSPKPASRNLDLNLNWGRFNNLRG